MENKSDQIKNETIQERGEMLVNHRQLPIENTYLLVGESIEEPIEVKGGLITYSDIIKDYYCNVVVVTDFNQVDLEKAEEFYKERKVSLSLAVLEEDLTEETRDKLKKENFILKSRNAYMVFQGKPEKVNGQIDISKAEGKEQEQDYIDIFRKVYCEGEGVYGGLSTDYIRATERYFKIYPKERRFDYVAYSEDKPIGITTFLFNDNFAVIIGVAVLPEYRGKGVAKSIIYKGITELEDKTFFLGTEAGTENELIYKRMGFDTKVIEDIFTKEGK